jgi:hypothetical protein
MRSNKCGEEQKLPLQHHLIKEVLVNRRAKSNLLHNEASSFVFLEAFKARLDSRPGC